MKISPTELSSDLIKQLIPRKKDAHKGDFGHVLIIGGDYGMAGAVRMAGEAALRVGAGLVTIATRTEHVSAISSSRPELMCYGVSNFQHLTPLLKRATIVVLGPGLGQSDWSQEIFQAINCNQPKVVDADGLNLLAKLPQKRQDWILTPHLGEAARLLQSTADEIQKNRIQSIQQLQKNYGGVVVLKGAGSLILTPEQELDQCTAGNPGMASPGMGDVLSGVIAGLLAQHLTPGNAAKTGVLIHALAGDKAAGEHPRGLLALDLMPYLRILVNP